MACLKRWPPPVAHMKPVILGTSATSPRYFLSSQRPDQILDSFNVSVAALTAVRSALVRDAMLATAIQWPASMSPILPSHWLLGSPSPMARKVAYLLGPRKCEYCTSSRGSMRLSNWLVICKQSGQHKQHAHPSTCKTVTTHVRAF
jgi:hypothetical protein